mgnify:CR=1 FL=1
MKDFKFFKENNPPGNWISVDVCFDNDITTMNGEDHIYSDDGFYLDRARELYGGTLDWNSGAGSPTGLGES